MQSRFLVVTDVMLWRWDLTECNSPVQKDDVGIGNVSHSTPLHSHIECRKCSGWGGIWVLEPVSFSE